MKRLLALALLLAASVAHAGPPVLAERLHAIYDPEARGVVRRVVRVEDQHPALGLAFQWEPAPGNWPGVDAEGRAEGPGVVSWRIEGLAAYDPRALHHRYEGGMKAGRFHGEGVLTYRDGAELAGPFASGRLEGAGRMRDAEGNSYRGPFVNGLPEGHGVWNGRDGSRYEGGFHAGLRQGEGRITEPGGLDYAVRYEAGEQVFSARPPLADPLLGGLLPSQSGGDAARMQMAVVLDQRVSGEQAVAYTSGLENGETLVYPAEEGLQNIWGGLPSSSEYILLEGYDAGWDAMRAHLLMDLSSTDGSRARLNSLDLAVSQSVPHLQPMLVVQEHYGCVGFRPDFHFLNYGWGAVEAAEARVRFVSPQYWEVGALTDETPGTGWYPLPVEGFDQGVDVSLRGALAEAGVDVTALESRRFSCLSQDLMEGCKETARNALNLGAVAPFVEGYDGLQTQALIDLAYRWTDAAGQARETRTPFRAVVNLAKIEVPAGLAECGGGGLYTTEAPQFTEVELPPRAFDYTVNIPFRGNPNISQLTAGLALWSRQSSFHTMQLVASFADGSQRLSPTLRLFWLRPRTPDFVSGARPAQCYLEEGGGC